MEADLDDLAASVGRALLRRGHGEEQLRALRLLAPRRLITGRAPIVGGAFAAGVSSLHLAADRSVGAGARGAYRKYPVMRRTERGHRDLFCGGRLNAPGGHEQRGQARRARRARTRPARAPRGSSFRPATVERSSTPPSMAWGQEPVRRGSMVASQASRLGLTRYSMMVVAHRGQRRRASGSPGSMEAPTGC